MSRHFKTLVVTAAVLSLVATDAAVGAEAFIAPFLSNPASPSTTIGSSCTTS